MTTGQTIEAKITVDAKQAIAELAKFDQETKAAEKALRDADAATKAFQKSQQDAVAAVTAIDTKIAKYERDMMALGNAILSGKGNTAAYEQELRQLGRELDALTGKTTAATVKTKDFARAASQVESSGRGGGLAMLEFSRAFEDAQYGITGVLNNIPGLLTALGVGAGLTGVVSVAAVGVATLVRKFGEMPGEAQAGADVAKERLKSLSEELVRINREIRVMAIGEYQADLEAARPEIEAEIKRISDMIQSIGGRAAFEGALFRTRGGTQMEGLNAGLLGRFGMSAGERALAPEIDPKVFREIISAREALQKRLSVIDAQARLEGEREAEKAMDRAIDFANEQTRIEQEQKEKAAKAREKEVAEYEKGVRDLIAYEEEWRTRQAKLDEKANLDRGFALQVSFELMDEERKAQEKHQKEMTKIAKREAQERKREEEKAAKEKSDAIKAAEKATSDYQIDLARMVSSQLLSSAQGYVEAKIKGEKDAEQKAIASFLSATGQQLVASGTRAIFEGAIISANPLTPGLGAGMIATGAAAVAVGLGMGAGGAALAPPPEAGGGGATSAARDRGASPRSARGGGEGGPLVVNVAYGVAGPLPEDTAREIAKAVKTGNRRRGAA